MHPHLPWGRGGVKNFRKIFLEEEVSNLNFDEGGLILLGGGGGGGGGHVIFK